MGHQYISLGAACNAATMMKIAGLRRASYPFDWLLNLEDGLTAVTAIINDDFKEISSADCYEVVHYAQVGSAVPVYRQYPRTYHVHSDPRQNQDAHEDMVRRCDRFRQVLKSTDHLHFVYYRNLSVCRGDRSGVSAAMVYEQMTAEASQFLSTISSRRRGKTSLLLILEADDEDTNEARAALSVAATSDDRIELGQTLSRYDGNTDLNSRWQKEWTDMIINRTHMPLWLRVKCRAKRNFRTLRSHFKRHL